MPDQDFSGALFVFALEQEAQGLFNPAQCLYTGIGKVNAAITLARYLYQKSRPSIIINLGTAGSAVHAAGQVVQAKRFIQRDMDVTALGFAPFQTPFSDAPPVLDVSGPQTALLQVTCGSGDNFETAHEGGAFDIVDMEAYALAYLCHQEHIPFLCLKYISDGADGAAHQDWEAALEQGARALHKELMRLF